MLARLLKITALAILGFATTFLALAWSHSEPIALMGFFGIVFSYCGLLSVQFLLLAVASRGDSVPLASPYALGMALVQEAIAATRVFFWWQLFRSNAIPNQESLPDNAAQQRGIVFVHGFLCNRGLWSAWFRLLQQRQIAFIAVNLEPVLGSIDDYTPLLDEAVSQITRSTGKAPLLVCHSMGGLVARAWLRNGSNDKKAHRIVTIASPHQGTGLGRFSPRLHKVVNADQMRFGSEWLSELARLETPLRLSRFTCFYSNCDNIVMPNSSAMLQGADNRLIPGVAHLAMVLDQRLMQQTLAML